MKHQVKFSYLFAGAAIAAMMAAAPAQARVDGDTVTLGAALSLTGKYSTAGQHTQRGYKMAVDYINKRGGIKVGGKSYKLDVKYYDDESNGARAAQLVERLIKQDGVKFMLGPYSSGLTVAVAPVTEKYKIPMVEGNGASRSLFTKGYKYLFAVLTTADQYLSESVKLAASNAKANGKEVSSVKLAFVFENDPFSQDVRLGVVAQAKKFGMKIVIDDKLPPDLNDMASSLNKVRALKPDLLVVSGHSKGAALAIRQMAQMKIKVPMLAMTHCEAAKVTDQKKFGKNAESTLCATQWDENLSYKDEMFGTAMDYYNDFKKIYGYAPPYQAAESTATVYVYAKALEAAGSFDTKKVRDALSNTNLKTFYGDVKFDSTGKNADKPMVLRQIQNGKYIPVAPEAFATGKFKAGM
ncbi:MAG: amino acid ABC transporter substrate-binding protein [Rhodospirillales bacterium]|nr:amino acid ABC transporter substrate-binding protein [Rhodospirillales bacterium]